MTKRFALIALLLVVVLGAGPGRGCKKDSACATFEDLSATEVFFNVTVSWTDTVNTTDSYHIEFETAGGGWENIGPAVISSNPSGAYAVTFFVLPGTTTFRVVASCGDTSDPVDSVLGIPD
jgi:hypothetical protein